MRKIADKDYFVRVVAESSTMAQASVKLKMPYSTFKRWAIKLNCYKPNQGGKGTVKPSKTKYDLEEILAGNHPEYSTYKLKNRLLKERNNG